MLLLKGGPGSVHLLREKINITVLPNTNAEVTADFRFYNSGAASTIKIGFPEDSWGDFLSKAEFARHTHFKSFRCWADGIPIKAKRVYDNEGSYDAGALWTKQLYFGKGQKRRVRIRYVSVGEWDASDQRGHSFTFGNGNWPTKVQDSLIKVNFLARGAWWISGRGGADKGWKGNLLTLRRRNGQNEKFDDDFHLIFISTLPSTTDEFPEWNERKNWFLITNPGYKTERGMIRVTSPPFKVQEGRQGWIQADILTKRRLAKDKTGRVIYKNRDYFYWPPILKRQWNAATKQFTFRSGSRQFTVNLKEARRNSARLPYRAGVPFLVTRRHEEDYLYLPLQQLERALLIRIGFDKSGTPYTYLPK